MLLRWICRLLFRLHGWRLVGELPKDLNQCVIIGAPHTSNWDFIYALAAFHQLSVPMHFTIKKEWLTFPLNHIFAPIGAIAIDRSVKARGAKRQSALDGMVALFDEYPRLGVLVTPEGTRSPVKNWKMGFYHLAVRAKVPIVLGYLDYGKKEASVEHLFYPTGDIKVDMPKIRAFYSKVTPCYPDKFIV